MDNTEIEARTVYKTYSRTMYGRKLAKRARYDRLRPANYSVKYWERLLGTDVNNLHHMRQSVRVAQWFVRHENAVNPRSFLRREALLLSVTGALHDQAEAIVGDIPYGRKSKYVVKKELRVLQEYETAFAPRLKGPALMIYRFGRDKIVFNKSSQKLPTAFKTIELLGFAKNTIRALHRLDQISKGQLSGKQKRFLGLQNNHRAGEVRTSLERLVAEVLGSGVFGQLIKLGQKYPSVHIFLNEHETEITRGFASVKGNTFDWYESGEDAGATSGEKESRMNHFDEQKQIWEQWIGVKS